MPEVDEVHYWEFNIGGTRIGSILRHVSFISNLIYSLLIRVVLQFAIIIHVLVMY